MGEKKMQNKKVLFLFLIILILLVGGFFVWKNFSDKEEKIAVEKSPIEVTDNGDGTKTVKNVEEGYEVVVDKGFVLENNPYNDALILTKVGGEQIEGTEFSDGISIQIYNDSYEGNVLDYIQSLYGYKPEYVFDLDGLNVYSFEDKIKYGADEPNPIIIENSSVDTYFIIKEAEIYRFVCTSVGKDYFIKKELCLNTLKQKFSL